MAPKSRKAVFPIIENANIDNVDESGYGEELRDFLKAKLAKTSAGKVSASDKALFCTVEDYFYPTWKCNFSLAEIVRGIVLRAKTQSVAFSTFMYLHEQGLVSAVGLEQPMRLGNGDPEEIVDVVLAFEYFEGFQAIDERSNIGNASFFRLRGYMAVK